LDCDVFCALSITLSSWSFKLLSENGETDLLKSLEDNSLPIYNMDVDFKGLGLFYMERDYASNTLPNEEFKDYLIGDNIENIQIDVSTKTEQTERYTRYIKSLIQSNPNLNDSIFETVVGQNFEIVLLQNPYELEVGEFLDYI
jgi:hypothetical protein